MILTDTHTHLYTEAFNDDRDKVIKEAIKENITRFFIPAIDASYTNSMLQLQERYPDNVYLMAGLHPTHVKENFKTELLHVEEQLKKHKYYAIGETGIDLYWDKSTLAWQQEAFVYQIQLAKKHKLPVVIHCRDAFDEIFEVLEGEKDDELFGIFHCFTGNLEQAERALSFNMKLGIGGVVTFKNGKIDTFLNQIPIEHIVLETDAPYLAPTPYRGKRNEPVYLKLVAQKVAQIYNISLDEVANITTENAKAVFGI